MPLCKRAGAVLYGVIIVSFSLFMFCGNAYADEMWTQLFEDNLQRAEAGDVDAQYEVGIMYLKGQGVDQNRAEAVKWLDAAAAAGNEQATGKLRRMQDQEGKFQELMKAAEGGDTAAQHDIAMMYLKGQGVQQDLPRAGIWFKKAAKQGDEKAITRLGIVLYKGELGKTDYAEAKRLFDQVREESVLAQYYLGEMYASGEGTEKNVATAITWYQRAADGGFKRALGKIINLEEELKMEQRRQANLERSEVVAKAEPAAPPARAVEPPKASAPPKPVVKPVQKAEPEKPRKPKPVPAPARSPLQQLAAGQWMRKDEPVEFLPSKVTRCELENDELVCFSEILQRTSGNKEVQYRVKSIARSSGKQTFEISYRNLVLDVVTQADDDDEQPLGYDVATDQGFHIQTGWTKEHSVQCEAVSAQNLECLKDKAHQITVVAR